LAGIQAFYPCYVVFCAAEGAGGVLGCAGYYCGGGEVGEGEEGEGEGGGGFHGCWVEGLDFVGWFLMR
jgi:hypothetical protein